MGMSSRSAMRCNTLGGGASLERVGRGNFPVSVFLSKHGI